MQVTLRELIHEYPAHNGPFFQCADDVRDELNHIAEASKEIFVAFYLDTKHRVIAREIIGVGIINASLIHPREVFRSAIFCNAQSIILAHNHPSGNIAPSSNDLDVTQLLIAAGNIIGIDVLDHVIVGGSEMHSMKENGELKPGGA